MVVSRASTAKKFWTRPGPPTPNSSLEDNAVAGEMAVGQESLEYELAGRATAEAGGDAAVAPGTRCRGRLPEDAPSAGKEDLVDYVARDLDTTKGDARLIVESVTRAIVGCIGAHRLVHVPGLGNFRILETPAREGRNPRTGESVPISPGRRLSFRAARPLKALLARRRR